MQTIKDAIHEWSQMQKNKKEFFETGDEKGGREAEEYLKNTVKAHFQWKNAYLFHSKRVPFADEKNDTTGRSSGRREIDLIVLTPKMIHIIEAKNLSGTIRQDGNNWIHTKRSGESHTDPDPTIENKLKMQYLQKYLQANGCVLPNGFSEKFISQKVILMHHRVLVTDEIYRNPNVIMARDLKGYVAGMKTDVLLSRIFKSIIEKCLDSESAMIVTETLFDSMTQEAYTKIKDTIENLGTWDYLSLHGGQIIRGDVISLQFNDGTRNIFRKRADLRERVLFTWRRGKILPLLGILIRALFFRPLKSLGYAYFGTHTSSISLLSEAFVLFHRAGEKQPEKYNLINVNRIELG